MAFTKEKHIAGSEDYDLLMTRAWFRMLSEDERDYVLKVHDKINSIKDKKNEIYDLVGKYNSSKKELEEKINSIEEKINSIEERIESLKDEYYRLDDIMRGILFTEDGDERYYNIRKKAENY